MKRTVKEINERIETLERRKFMLAMKDNWNRKDFETDRQLAREILALEKELEEV